MSTSGQAFPARAFHSTTFDNNNNLLYVSGGYNGNILSDIWVLDSVKCKIHIWQIIVVDVWSQIVKQGYPVYAHTSQYVNGQIYIFCGQNSENVLNTTYVYNPSTGNSKLSLW